MGKKIWNFVTTLVLVLMLLVIAVIYVPKFLGFEPMIVLSGSMEPTYHVGSLLYVKDAEEEEIEVGDAITFYIDEDTLVTHRVVSIDEEAGTYSTKGDANEVEDGNAIAFEDILGVPVFNIPKLGYLADKLSNTSGKIIYITIIVVVVILMYMADLIWPEEKKKKEEGNEETESQENKA